MNEAHVVGVLVRKSECPTAAAATAVDAIISAVMGVVTPARFRALLARLLGLIRRCIAA